MFFRILKRFLTLPAISPEVYPEPDGECADFPLDPESPWPKFRANPMQNGRSSIVPDITNAAP